MDASNLAIEFGLILPSIEVMLMEYKKEVEGSMTTKKAQSTGITYI